MANLFERLSTALSPVRYNDLARRARERDLMRQEQPQLWQRIGEFSELDDRMIDMLRRFKDYETVYGVLPMTSMELTNADRLEVVQRSRIWSAADPLISHAIELWTSYGFGQQVQVTATDPEAQAVFDTFWEANEQVFGDRDIHELSDNLLTDGELWLALYTNVVTGDVLVRPWPTEQIVDVVTADGDLSVPLLYKRKWRDARGDHERYYRDYQVGLDRLDDAPIEDGIEIARELDGYTVALMPIQFKRLGAVGSGWLRGWPLPTAALDWAQAYRQFCEDRAAVARKIASEVEEFRAKTGQRGIEAMIQLRQSSLMNANSYTETNPPPGAGSERWMNDAIESRRLSMATGAQDAAADSMLLIGQVATAMGVPAFMLGRTDMLQNKATAEVAMQPTLRVWNSYQLLWRDVFTDLFNYVLDAQTAHNTGIRATYEERGVTVDLSSPLDTDYEAMVNSVIQYWDRGVVQAEVLSYVALSQPEMGLSPEAITDILDAMYPERAQESVKRDAVAFMQRLLAEGHELEDGHRH